MLKSTSLSLIAAAAALCVAMPASAVTSSFSASLSSLGEPVPTSTATGQASVLFDDLLYSVNVHVSFQGLSTNLSAGHIHCCTAVPNTGSVGVSLGVMGLPTGTTGTYDRSFTLTPTAFSTLLAGVEAGRAYVNLHTPGTYAAGEIRGFLAPVPEPGTYALMLGGLALVGWTARRRRSV